MIVVETRPACEQLGYVHNITFGTCQLAGHGDFALTVGAVAGNHNGFDSLGHGYISFSGACHAVLRSSIVETARGLPLLLVMRSSLKAVTSPIQRQLCPV